MNRANLTFDTCNKIIIEKICKLLLKDFSSEELANQIARFSSSSQSNLAVSKFCSSSRAGLLSSLASLISHYNQVVNFIESLRVYMTSYIYKTQIILKSALLTMP